MAFMPHIDKMAQNFTPDTVSVTVSSAQPLSQNIFLLFSLQLTLYCTCIWSQTFPYSMLFFLKEQLQRMSETLTSPSSRQADLIPQPDLITVSVHTQWHTIFPSPSNIYPLCTWPKMCLKWLLSIQDSFLSVTRLSTFFYWSTKLLTSWPLMNVYARKQFHFRQGISAVNDYAADTDDKY